jgi:hypothetical protein
MNLANPAEYAGPSEIQGEMAKEALALLDFDVCEEILDSLCPEACDVQTLQQVTSIA